MADKKLVEVRDEYYRKPDGALRHRRYINGVEIWDSDAMAVFLDIPYQWPWEKMGDSLNSLVREAPKSLVPFRKP